MIDINDFDSQEEIYFYWWLEELKAIGLIKSYIYQPKPFQLSESVEVIYEEHLKTKIKRKAQNILSGHQYQADFLIYWDEKLHDRLFAVLTDIPNKSFKKFPFIADIRKGRMFSVVDVKGTFNQNDAWRRFSIDQKWVYQKFDIFVNKIIPAPNSKGTPNTTLFRKTFIPERYLMTDAGKQRRKIKYEYLLLKEYLRTIGFE
jgi:hypothetical protein